ncbi:MAG: DivIVA domain-containing protein [Candidatus Zixiibacteriota bacterium]
MPLSPRDIRSQTFKKSLFGYKITEVDFFVEELAKSIDELRREIDNLKAEKEHTIERIENYEQQTSAVKETLELAREKGRKIIDDSQNQANIILENAKERAEEILQRYQEEFNRARLKLNKLNSLSDNYKRRFGLMLNDTMRKIEEFENSIDARKTREEIDNISSDVMVKEPVEEWKWAQNSKFIKRK